MRRTLWRAAVLAAAAGVLPAAAQDPAAELPLPAAFAAAGGAGFRAEPLDRPFWEEMGDTALTRLVTEALAASPDVRVAAGRLRSARAASRLARFDYAPTVTAAAGYSRARLASVDAPGLSDDERRVTTWDGGVDASWEVDVFGRVRGNARGQGALASAAAGDLRDVRLSLATEVARTYHELRGAQGRLDVARRNAENQRRALELARERLDAGRGTAFDTERARAQLSSTLAAIPSLEAQVTGQHARLSLLLGRTPDARAVSLDAAPAAPALPAAVSLGTPATLVRARPDVASAERQLAARSAFVSAARADYLPRLTVGARAGVRASEFDALREDGGSRWSFGPVVSWPFLDMGRVRARVDAARGRQEEARAVHTATVLRALAEAETAAAAYDRARARLSELEAAADASRRAAALAQIRYEEGVTDFLQVLDAQRTLLDAETQLVAGRTDAATALVALYRAVGGGLPPEEGEVVPSTSVAAR